MSQQNFHHDIHIYIHLYTDIDKRLGTRIVFGMSPPIVAQNFPHKFGCENDVIKFQSVIANVIAGTQSLFAKKN